MSESFWSDELLQDIWNRSMDKRVMELAEQHEGWVTTTFKTDLVAGQAEYTLPEGAGRVKRVLRVITEGDVTHTSPLIRAERWAMPTRSSTSSTVGRSTLPTYRLVGQLILLEPTPQESETDGLQIDLEFSPDRFDEDTDKLDQRFPDVMEALLVYDTAVEALAIEGSQGNLPQGYVDHLIRERNEYAANFFDFTAVRSYGRVFSQAYYLGD